MPPAQILRYAQDDNGELEMKRAAEAFRVATVERETRETRIRLTLGLDGRPVLASNGLDLAPTIALDKLGKVEILFVCGGVNVREAVTAPLLGCARAGGDGPVQRALIEYELQTDALQVLRAE